MSKRSLLLGFAASAALLAGAGASADPAAPMGVPDLVGARALALGAYRGVASGNDGIWTNAASLAARKRYAIESYWLLDHAQGQSQLQVLGTSVVDSETSSVTGGFGYTYVLSGPWQGHILQVPIAFPLTEGFFLGVTGKYQSLDGPAGDAMRAGNFDLSAFWQVTNQLSVGFSAYNLLAAGHRYVEPRAIGAGVSYGNDRLFRVSFDWRGDLQRQKDMTNLFAAGGEVLLGDMFPLRASYVNDQTRNASFVSGGVGIVTAAGFALDLSYRQGLEDSSDRTFAAAVKLFLSSR